MADRSQRLGSYVVTVTGDERVRAFVPPPLPPEPPVQLSPLQGLLEQANQALEAVKGDAIDGAAVIVP